MVDNSREGDHGKAAVLDLSKLKASPVSSLSEAERIKSEVTGLASGSLEHLDDGGSADSLEGSQPEQHLAHGAGLEGSVVELGQLEVAAVNSLGPREAEEILRDASSNGEHSNTAVLELSLAQPLDVEPSGDGERVKANVSSPGSIEGWGVGASGERDGSDTLALDLSITKELHADASIARTASSWEERGRSEGRGRGCDSRKEEHAEHGGE
mmetsp:Transcript_20153/g.67378  ORF Transcript_20153/g.67378 Transcript_20153/m.67378 type:complete len:212 (+) Transcript_20153:173-808(+)